MDMVYESSALSLPCVCPPSHGGPKDAGPRAGSQGSCVGLKAPNMQEDNVLPLYATPFMRVHHPFTGRPLEVRCGVYRHCVPHVDIACSRQSATVDTNGMWLTRRGNIRGGGQHPPSPKRNR